MIMVHLAYMYKRIRCQVLAFTDMNDVGMNMQNRQLMEESVCMNSSLK